MLKELLLGSLIGVLIFISFQGIDVAPFFLLIGLGGLAYWLVEKRGLVNNLSAQVYSSANKVTFADIGGQGTAIRELKEALDFLLRGERVKAMGIRPLKGILLSGPPGTGKTLMAKAAAAYTDAVFLAASGSEFIEVYAGVGAQRIRNLFKRGRELGRASKKKRAVIFIDELEVLGGKRGSHSSHLEYDQTLNQLLVEMDGLDSVSDVNVLVIGATNRADLLDPALLRPGRFDRVVKVDLPDREGRLQILKLHVANKPLAGDVDLEALARETFGFSGAHLESVANEAAILALREDARSIEMRHFREAIEKVMLGEKLGRKPGEAELYRLAVHEAGHALESELLRPQSVTHVTITSRGQALGYTRQRPAGDMYLYTREYLEEQLRICLAGAVAEDLLCGGRSTGSVNDFKEAIRLARVIITSGLSPLGVVAEEDLSKTQMHKISSQIIREQEAKVAAHLGQYRHYLEAIALKLKEEESLSGEALRSYLPKAANT
ncbi:MAG: vesicle-fusing ATPase [Clostridia bacterium]|nr:vesicle-fusing ATPase [Clostridia bacterium]